MKGISNLTIFIIFLLTMNVQAGQQTVCGQQEPECTSVEVTQEMVKYEIKHADSYSPVKIEYLISHSITTEFGIVTNKILNSVHIQNAKIEVTLDNCTKSDCNKMAFVNYLTTQFNDVDTLWALFFSDAVKYLMSEWIKKEDLSRLEQHDTFFKSLENDVTGLSANIYVYFIGTNREPLGWVQLGRDRNRELHIKNDLIFAIGSNSNGQSILHMNIGALESSDWFRDYVYVYHTIHGCGQQQISYQDNNGFTTNGLRMVCSYSNKQDY
ncbi:hypothetical protein RT723_04865 [Psychrosphaera aquimarina]|uniref:Uncharacterized protein n=1 Tax=Psychrosphaera aquimarina TaxID=2044854 RepID=A0ABU3QY32_9GAMM|nr:hypothetical protein [Psychrosphaera aquimarina]MDU0112341.1 hypothetical protein [Psychrosphaera aquimarina]